MTASAAYQHESRFRSGETIGGYRLDRLVSDGPFAEVWRGAGRTPVAVKVGRGELGARLIREEVATVDRLADAAAVFPRDFGGPGTPHWLVPILSHGEDPPHLVMPWVGERTFRDVLRDVRTADARATAIWICCKLIDVVSEVHAHGVVHGDLKPENVLIDSAGWPCLIDFGLARQLREARLDSSLSQSLRSADDVVGGTLAYMPPEAIKGAPPSFAGDVYALGVMLHEALLGARPDKACSSDALGRQVPAEVAEVLLRALHADPGRRHQRASNLRLALEPLRTSLTATGATRLARRVARFVLAGLAAFFVALRYASVTALLTAYAVGLVAGAIGSLVEPPAGIAVAFLAGMILALHRVIRWEGPESNEEVAERTFVNRWTPPTPPGIPRRLARRFFGLPPA